MADDTPKDPDAEKQDDELTAAVDLADRLMLDRVVRIMEIVLRPCDIGTSRDVGLSAAAGEAISTLVIAACDRGRRILGADLCG